MTYEDLKEGESYTINRTQDMVYKYSLYSGMSGCMQHWFFHKDGHFTCSLRDLELQTFIK